MAETSILCCLPTRCSFARCATARSAWSSDIFIHEASHCCPCCIHTQSAL
uniref:Uncharacterized protein n=1 Tax=Anguilla anguilla TaxID=7936 RepID=A0A0E9P8A6_ANGAN